MARRWKACGGPAQGRNLQPGFLEQGFVHIAVDPGEVELQPAQGRDLFRFRQNVTGVENFGFLPDLRRDFGSFRGRDGRHPDFGRNLGQLL